MVRLVATVVVVLAVLIGATVLLAGHAHERPPVRVEKAVDLANLS